MFCTKCGKELYDEDFFCAYCGTKSRKEDLHDEEKKSVENVDEKKPVENSEEKIFVENSDEKFSVENVENNNVIFNPPFKNEVENVEIENVEVFAEKEESIIEPKKSDVDFNWNLDGFPTREDNDDGFEISWDAVIEKQKNGIRITEKIGISNMEDGTNVFSNVFEPVCEPVDVSQIENKKDVSLSMVDLEKEIFGAEDLKEPLSHKMTIKYNLAQNEKDRKAEFYTYNEKKDAFQDLLDKERERVESLEKRRQGQWEEITGGNFAEQYEEKEPPKFEEVFVEPAIPMTPPLKEVDVVQAPATSTVEAKIVEPPVPTVTKVESKVVETPVPTVTKVEEATPKVEKENPPREENNSSDTTKLRFSDVFPTSSSPDDSNSGNNTEAINKGEQKPKKVMKKVTPKAAADDDEDINKGSKILKIVIIILAIIVTIEFIAIGIKLAAPDSGFAKSVDGMMSNVTSSFSQAISTDTTT
jgi:hypothetical protein